MYICNTIKSQNNPLSFLPLLPFFLSSSPDCSNIAALRTSSLYGCVFVGKRFRVIGSKGKNTKVPKQLQNITYRIYLQIEYTMYIYMYIYCCVATSLCLLYLSLTSILASSLLSASRDVTTSDIYLKMYVCSADLSS
jgi:hypothetical protein